MSKDNLGDIMSVKIGERYYRMEDIEGIARIKWFLTKEIEGLIKRLRKEFQNDKKFQWKTILSEKEIGKLGKRRLGMKEISKKTKEGLIFIIRDMDELKKESWLLNEIYMRVKDLHEKSLIEQEYFEKSGALPLKAK